MNSSNNMLYCLLALLLLSGSNAVYANTAGYVQFVTGDVQLTTATGQIHKIQKGDAVNEGDTLTSAKNASTQIKMQDGGFVAMRPDTQLKFDSFKFSGKEDGTEQSFFSLFKGGFRAVTGLIGRINKPSYRITTPAATIGIRGTDHETFVVAPGSEIAAVAPPGAYNKVNLGETYMATDKGTIFVLPNQMGFAGAADQMPQLQPINTNIFTVAAGPTPQAKGDKQEGKEEVRETAVVDNTAQEQAAAPAPTTAAPENTVTTNFIQLPIETTGGTNLTGGALTATAGNGVTPPATGLNFYSVEYNATSGAHNAFNTVLGTDATFDAQGVLTAVAGNYDRQAAQSLEGGSDAGAVSWGRWTNGTVLFYGWGVQTYTVNQGSHIFVGVPVVAYPQMNAVAYNFLAATRPTEATNVASGNVWQATGGTLTANFLTNNLSANLNLTLNGNSTYLMNVTGATATNTVNSISGAVAFQGGTQNVCGTGGCSTTGNVLFAGQAATHAGMGYEFSQTNGTFVQGLAIFKQ